MARIFRVIEFALLLSAIAIFIACGGAGTNRRAAREWYQGGTLHNKTVREWRAANDADKLATCADFVARIWDGKKFKPSIQQGLHTPEDMKPYAIELVSFINAYVREHPDDLALKIDKSNEPITEIAALGMVGMGWGGD
jgi:hypothetical protein